MVLAPLITLSAAGTEAMGPWSNTATPWLNSSIPRSKRVAALLEAMTTDEKIAQMVVAAPAIPRLQVPAYHWRNNVLHGTVDNGVSTQFVQAIGLAATWDVDAINGAARVIADEQRAKHNVKLSEQGSSDSPMNYGLDLWGPNVNLFVHPLWGRGQETYGEDPILTAKLAKGFIRGLQYGAQTRNRLGETFYETIATCKHFVGHSVDKQPPRLSLDENISRADLSQYYGPAWEACAKEAISVMCAYNGVNGAPMCVSPLIGSELRGRHGFGQGKPEAYVVTDSGALDFTITKFHRYNTSVDAAAAGLNAGVDLNSGTIYASLGDALSKGMVQMSMIDAALTRLLHARMALGLFDPPSEVSYSGLGLSDILSAPHVRAARSVSQKSLVLLKNRGGLLPLKLEAVRARGVQRDGDEATDEHDGPQRRRQRKAAQLAVIGWAANDTYVPLGNYMGCGYDAWGPRLPNCSIVTPLAGLQAAYAGVADVIYARGCDVESNDTSGFGEAVQLAAASDVVIFMGGNRNCEGGQGQGGAHCESEGHDRPDLEMPGVQTELLQKLYQANPQMVLVLVTGSPIAMRWEAEHLPAILVLWYAGQQGGNALADALTGAISPGGRSPFTWPTGMSQLPPDILSPSPTAAPGRTYRHLTQTPLYSFGFGLSYATVSYSAASVSPAAVSSSSAAAANASVTVCVHVANDAHATHAAEEVVQVYATPQADARRTAVAAPRTWLVGFVRTPLIHPGDTSFICLEVALSDMRLASTSSEAPFAVQAGTYTLSVGGAPPGPLGVHVEEGCVAPRANATLVVQ